MKHLTFLPVLLLGATAAPAAELPGWFATWLGSAEGRIGIDIGRLELAGRVLTDVHAPLTLEGGLATLREGSASLDGSPVSVSGAVEVAASRWAIALQTDELNLRAGPGNGAPAAAIDVAALRGGRVDLAAGRLNLPGLTALAVEASLRVPAGGADQGTVAGYLRSDRLTVHPGDERPAMALPAWLPATPAAVEVALGQVDFGGLSVTDVELPLTSGNGALRVRNGRLRLAGGELRLHAEYLQPTRESSVRITASDVALGDLNIIEILDEGAPTAVDIDLRATGQTLEQLAGTLTGRVYVDVGPGYLSNNAIDRLSKSWFAIGLDRFNPLADMDGRGELQCANIDLTFKAGRADAPSGFAMRTSEVALIGGGVIDLRESSIAAELQPRVRKTPLLGSATVVQMVRIEGPLNNPQTQLETGGLLNKGRSLGLSLLTLGASPLGFAILQAGETLFDWSVSADTACEMFVRADDG